MTTCNGPLSLSLSPSLIIAGFYIFMLYSTVLFVSISFTSVPFKTFQFFTYLLINLACLSFFLVQIVHNNYHIILPLNLQDDKLMKLNLSMHVFFLEYVQPILEHVDGCSIHDRLRRSVAIVDCSLTQEFLFDSKEGPFGEMPSRLSPMVLWSVGRC